MAENTGIPVSSEPVLSGGVGVVDVTLPATLGEYQSLPVSVIMLFFIASLSAGARWFSGPKSNTTAYRKLI